MPQWYDCRPEAERLRALAAHPTLRARDVLRPARRLLSALLFVFSAVHAAPAQNPNAPIRAIYVEPFQGKPGIADLQARVTDRLRARAEFHLVDSRPQADAILRGAGALWVKGYFSVSPHDPASVREPVYGGYLSLELESPGGSILWSYLVTPGGLRWKSAGDDMADHIVRRLAEAVAGGRLSASSPLTPAAAQLSLAGAGSTFAAPLYEDWIDSYEERHPQLHATYQAVGSEEGIRLLDQGKVDFAASDVPMSDEQMAAQGVRFDNIATVLGAVVPAYNLAGVGRDLRFTPEVLADIYLGKIVRWSDSRLRSLNHAVSLPDVPIVVVHRSDGSGTTATFTAFLGATSPEWKSSVGSGMRVAWPVGQAEDGNDGVAAKVAATPGAIGYMELTWAIRNQLSFGMVRNAGGAFVQANLATLSDAAASAQKNRDLRASLVNAPGRDAWPITTFTWILVPTSSASPQKAAALRDLLRWMLTAGQKDCSALGYLPLPRDIADREARQLAAPSGSASAPSSAQIPAASGTPAW